MPISPHRRRIGVTAAAVSIAAALALSACSTGSEAPAADDAKPVSGGTLDIAFWPDNVAFPCVDPFQVYWIEHRSVIRNFADSLTDQDPKTGEIVPWLATDWTVSDDAKVYTFDLRTDVTFSDGEAFNAEAVKTAFDANKALLTASPTTFGGTYITGYDHTEVVDDDTVKVYFTTPNAAFLQGTSTTNLAILAPKSYETSAADRCLGKGVIGSGPFVLDSYAPNESLTLSKRPGYAWGSELNKNTGEAYVDTVNITYVAEDSVRTGNLTSGAIDIDWPRNPFTETDAALLAASDDTLEARSLPGPSSAWYPNVSDGHPLADPDVRQAVQEAIDRATYASTIYGADYPVVEGPFNSTTPYFTSEADKLGYNPKGAAKLLDAAGWKKGSDGYREKDGTKLTLVYPVTAALPGDVLVQDQLKQVGIDLELKVITAAERAGVIASGAWDFQNTYYTRADPGVLQWILDARVAGSKALAVNSQTAEDAAKVAALFDAGIAETDPTKRAAIYAELQDLLIDENIVFPIFERVQQAGVAPSVHGFRFTSESFLALNDVWIDGE